MADAYEIIGREFDWFAVDKSGKIALFSSAGCGVVPEAVLDNFQQHDKISEILDPLNLVGPADFSKIGFFVFDWDQNKGPYKKVSESMGDMDSSLKGKILEIKGLPEFDVSFSKIKELSKK